MNNDETEENEMEHLSLFSLSPLSSAIITFSISGSSPSCSSGVPSVSFATLSDRKWLSSYSRFYMTRASKSACKRRITRGTSNDISLRRCRYAAAAGE